MMTEERIGKIVHYWPRAHAAQVALEGSDLHVGDHVRIRGHGHDFEQEVSSIQIDHESRREGHPGEAVAFATEQPVHEGDEVLRLD